MPDHLIALGMFVFGMESLPYQALERRTDWRHGLTDRLGARPAGQFLGPGAYAITLTGILVPEITGGYGDIDRLHEMGDTGELYPLVLGTGKVLGDFRILAVDDRWSDIVAGGLGRNVEFAVDLEKAGA